MPGDPAAAGERALRDFLAARITGDLQRDDPALVALLAAIRARFGASLAAVLVYGSWTRGRRDTLIDLYALLDGYRAMPWWQASLCRLLPPNVYQLMAGGGDTAARAKCAAVSLDRFEAATSRDFHSYFWARFVQPSMLLYCRDEATRDRVVGALAAAVRTFVRRVTPLLPHGASPRDLWVCGLKATYRCELRAEKPGYAEGLVDAHPDYFGTLARLAAPVAVPDGSTGSSATGRGPGQPVRVAAAWRLRRLQGKLLSAARLVKAATMFEAPLDYILWKIERHSGIRVEATARQRRHPFLFAWPLFWRLYRQGAFR